MNALQNHRVAAEPRTLHVAVVDEELPYPLTSGKRIRTLNLLLRLARRHRITYLCHQNADADEATQAAAYLEDHGIETIVVSRSVPRKSGMLFYGRLAANLVSPLPYSVASHRSRELRRTVSSFVRDHGVDLCHCEWTPYAEVIENGLPVPTLIMAHNVESMIWRRYHETEEQRLRRWYIKEQWRKYRKFESRVCKSASRVVAVSSSDAAVLQHEFGASRVDVVDNGVDLGRYHPTLSSRDPARILFLGSLDWRPNLDAAALLLDRIFPLVRSEVPNARLSIVGRNPPESLVRQVQSCAGAELFANVEDVRPYLSESGVMAVPLRIGGGSRLKILEALAMELPVVSTVVGAEGLELTSGEHLFTVDGIEEMPRILVDCIRSPEQARRIARSGREVVQERYDWDRLAEKLESAWFRCIAN